jgi:hypothetical protein
MEGIRRGKDKENDTEDGKNKCNYEKTAKRS